MKTAATTQIASAPENNARLLAACCLVFFTFLVTLSILATLATSSAFAKPAPQSGSSSDAGAPDQPVELGDIHWKRDLDDAVAISKTKDKPIALLFQEVPG